MKTLLSLTLLAALTGPIYAVDGVVLINQSNALAGNVTPGDTPGFPVSITVSGSYRLSSNLIVPDANTSGILVSADNVTIDLNGFSVIGPVVCTGFPAPTSCSPQGGISDGITLGGNGLATNVVVLNGDIHGFSSFAIDLGLDTRIENVHASHNGFAGIRVSHDSRITSCRVNYNLFDGIESQDGAVISGNTVIGNGRLGIDTICISLIQGNLATSNAGGNLNPFGPGCVLVNNLAP